MKDTAAHPQFEPATPSAASRSDEVPPGVVTSSVSSPAFRNTYANSLRVGISQWDLTVTFGQVVEASAGNAVVQDEVAIKFSPPFFKMLVQTLNNSLLQWERTFGEISLDVGQASNPKNVDDAFDRFRDALQHVNQRSGRGDRTRE